MIHLAPNTFTPWDHARTAAAERLGIPPTQVARLDRVLSRINLDVWSKRPKYLLGQFFVDVDCDGRFWAPPGYGPIYRIQIDGRPIGMKDRFFQFHLNGPGDDANWGQPVTTPSKVRDAATLGIPGGGSFLVEVVSHGAEAPGAEAQVGGVDPNESEVYSLVKRVKRVRLEEAVETVRLPHIAFPLNGTSIRSVGEDNAEQIWAQVTRIDKPQTVNPVSVFARPLCGGDSVLIARLEGQDTSSSYTCYQLSRAELGFWNKKVRALFRPSMPTGPGHAVWVPPGPLLDAFVTVADKQVRATTIGDRVEADGMFALVWRDLAAAVSTAEPDTVTPHFEVATGELENTYDSML